MDKVTYYGWLGIKGYDGVVKIVNGIEAYLYTPIKNGERNDYYLKAACDPGSDFDEITEDEAKEIIKKL